MYFEKEIQHKPKKNTRLCCKMIRISWMKNPNSQQKKISDLKRNEEKNHPKNRTILIKLYDLYPFKNDILN